MPEFLFEIRYLDDKMPKGELIGKKVVLADTFDDACDLIDEIENDIILESGIVPQGSYRTSIIPINDGK